MTGDQEMLRVFGATCALALVQYLFNPECLISELIVLAKENYNRMQIGEASALWDGSPSHSLRIKMEKPPSPRNVKGSL